jgi:hypothetical protein
MEKIPSKIVRKFIFNFTPKNSQKYTFLSRLKQPHLENRLSVKAQILPRIPKNLVFGLDGKIPLKMVRKLIFSFTPKKRPKMPLLGLLKTAIS